MKTNTSNTYPKTGRTYALEAAIQVAMSDEFDIDKLGETWSMVDFGEAVVRKYKELLNETM